MRLSSPTSPKRTGVVLLGVLIVIVIMALIAYQYSDRMVAEYTAASNAHRTAQVRHFADSGVHYAAAMLADPNNIDFVLNGNPYDNPDSFADVPVPDTNGGSNAGRFTLVAPVDPDQSLTGGAFRAGVTDEGGKINLNAFMKRDSSGQQLYEMLVKLPNMTEEIAAAIVDWLDSDTQPREGGAEDDFYNGQNPPYRCKNGPLDTLDELLLVRGVTRELLYGSDLNRNGFVDGNENSVAGSADRGWSSFLTVSSRESNRDAAGEKFININGDDLTMISEQLVPEIGEDLMKYIILYRQYGPTSSTGSSQTLGSAIAALFASSKSKSSSKNTVQGNLAEYQPNLAKRPSRKLNSFFDLVATQVSVPGSGKSPTKIYNSPLNDANSIRTVLPILYLWASLTDDAEIPARINVNTASREVLECIEGFSEGDVATIIAMRPKWSASEPPGPEFQTPAWLASDATLKLTTLRNLEKVITTRSQVYHMQVVGQFASGDGPTARVEAIVDTNYGRPRILMYRDWTELGRTRLP